MRRRTRARTWPGSEHREGASSSARRRRRTGPFRWNLDGNASPPAAYCLTTELVEGSATNAIAESLEFLKSGHGSLASKVTTAKPFASRRDHSLRQVDQQQTRTL